MSAAPKLRAALFSVRETHPSSHVYILLNQDCPVPLEHPLHPDQLGHRPFARQLARVAHQANDHSLDSRPLWLQLYKAGENGYVDEEVLDLSIDNAQARCASINGAYVAAWVASDLEPEALATRLSVNCQLFDPTQGRTRHHALYEPHRMALLEQEPDAMPFIDRFLEGCHLWAFVDASGQLRCLRRANREGPQAGAPSRLPLNVARAQARVNVARLALLGLVKAGHTVPARAEQRIDQSLQTASRLGLAADEDLVFFVVNDFSLSPRWHEHPEAQRCIGLSRMEGAPLAGLLAELPDQVLDEIARYHVAS